MIDLVNFKKPYKFKLHSILKFGIQAIEAIQIVHNKGFIHQDIKPSNFLIGNTPDKTGSFYLINFKMCKRITTRDGVVVKPTNESTFQGSLMYASLNAHKFVDLGRNDDLMSLLYILVEFYNGKLPWTDNEDVDQTEQLKLHYHGHKLLKWLPKQFLLFESYILSLDYTTDPDYAYLISLFKQAAYENEIDLNAPFDFEEEMNNERNHIIMHHIQQAQKIDYKIEQLENKQEYYKNITEQIGQFELYNNSNQQQIDQLDKEINDLKQQILNPQQLKIKLGSLNIMKRLRKKYDQIYQQQEQKQQNLILKLSPEIKFLNNSSHIRPIKSQLSNANLPESNSICLFSNQNYKNQILQQSTETLTDQSDQFNYLSRKEANLNLIDIRPRANTVQELVEVLDALIYDNTNDSNIFDYQQIKLQKNSQQLQQQSQNKYTEQFMNDMKLKDKQKINDFNWDQFIGSIGGSIESEQYDSLDVLSNNESITGIITNKNNIQFDQEQEQIDKSDKVDSQCLQSNFESDIQTTNLFSPSISETSQQQQIQQQQQQQQSTINSSLIQIPINNPPINNKLQHQSPVAERILSPELLESKVFPITEVIHSQRNSIFKNNKKKTVPNIKTSNQNQNSKSQLLIFEQSFRELDSMPTTPANEIIQDELKEWNLLDTINNNNYNNTNNINNNNNISSKSILRKQNDQEMEQQLDINESKQTDLKMQEKELLYNKCNEKNNLNNINTKLNKQTSCQQIEISSLSKQDEKVHYKEDLDKSNEIDDLNNKIGQNKLNKKISTSSVLLEQQPQQINKLGNLAIDNEIVNTNENKENLSKDQTNDDDNNILSPFTIRRNNENNKLSPIYQQQNENNQILSQSQQYCNMQIKQFINTTNQIINIPELSQCKQIQSLPFKTLSDSSQTYQSKYIQSKQTNQTFLNKNQNSQILENQIPNTMNSPDTNIHNTKLPQIDIYYGLLINEQVENQLDKEIDLRNEIDNINREQNQYLESKYQNREENSKTLNSRKYQEKEQQQEGQLQINNLKPKNEEKVDKLDKQQFDSLYNHNFQGILNNSVDIELSAKVNRSCCTII